MGPKSNPFSVNAVLSPEDFIGRQSTVARIVRYITVLGNVNIIAEHRTGATSLLRYLAHRSTSVMTGLPGSCIPVYFDFQSLPTRAGWDSVLHALREAITQEIGHVHPTVQTVIEDAELDGLPTYFALRALFAELGRRGLMICLLFDEFELTAYNTSLRNDFYSALRGLATNYEVSFVIATRISLWDLERGDLCQYSPFGNIFHVLYLGPFREAEVRDLIFKYLHRAGLGPSVAEKLAAESSFIYDLTGYHPLFVQILCYHLFDRLEDRDWPLGEAKEEAIRAFETDAVGHFKYYWDISSDVERRAMQRLAVQEPMGGYIHDALPSLAKRCLAVADKNSECGYRLFSSSFSDWCLRQSSEAKGVLVEGALSREQLAQLLRILDEHFNEGELQTLCFELGVDYDNLPGKGKANKARELIKHLRRRARVLELVETGKMLRSDIKWLDIASRG